MLELLDDATIGAMRDAARDAAIAAAKAFGFGGASWTAPASGTLTAYAYRQRPGVVALAAPGAAVLDDIWRMIVVSGTVYAGDVLTSVADGRSVTVKSVELWYDYQRCELERQR